MKLSAKPHDDLNWQIEGNPEVFEFDLGLNDPYFPLEDELYFQSICAGLTHFTNEIWPRFPESKAILYRGKGDFSSFFSWSERQLANYQVWKEDRPQGSEDHLKRLFCAESFVTYFQMLAHRLPDELPLSIIVDPNQTGTLAQTLHLFSPERFEHFTLDTGLKFESTVGVCFPADSECSSDVIEKIDRLLSSLPSFRPVYEPLLTEQWEGLDDLIVIPEAVTAQGKRKLMGFVAAGGNVIELDDFEIRGRGIRTPDLLVPNQPR